MKMIWQPKLSFLRGGSSKRCRKHAALSILPQNHPHIDPSRQFSKGRPAPSESHSKAAAADKGHILITHMQESTDSQGKQPL